MNTQLVKTIEKLGNAPEKKFRAGAIAATVWLNKGQQTNGEETEFRTISLNRRYADKNGQWQSTSSFRISDLPKAQVVLQKAFEYLVLNEQEQFAV
ncbi:MAG TPA: hypothetical protein VJH68_02845 [Candidatus Nanoarchaeia archaeon]|nr:hypothetical protein [Candidatus Nanoarchaeia archaeon]